MIRPGDGIRRDGDGQNEHREPAWIRNLSRRDFVRGSLAVVGSGMVLGIFVGCGEEEADQ